MRKYTFLVSMVAHVSVVAAVLLTTVVVTHSLPGVPPMFEFVLVRAELPPPPPPPAPRAAEPLDARLADIPVEAPPTVLPEPDVPPAIDDRSPARVGDDFGVAGGTGDRDIGDPVPPPAPPPAPKPVAPVPVGGVVIAPTKVRHVPPVYPPIALAARKQGVVILEAVIADDGTVRELRVLRSEPLLDQAAIDAVKQWRFTPTLLNGQPTPVIMTVSVVFNLQ